PSIPTRRSSDRMPDCWQRKSLALVIQPLQNAFSQKEIKQNKKYWKAVMTLSNKTILPGQTIGIIGGGQLGRMMALAAKANGFRIAVLDPSEDSPCGQVADIRILGEYGDLDSIKELAKVSDVVTYEFEN